MPQIRTASRTLQGTMVPGHRRVRLGRLPTPPEQVRDLRVAPTNWACQDHPDPDVFFPVDADDLTLATLACATCPAQRLCEQVGRIGKEEGVWGGKLLSRGVEVREPLPAKVTRRTQRSSKTTNPSTSH